MSLPGFTWPPWAGMMGIGQGDAPWSEGDGPRRGGAFRLAALRGCSGGSARIPGASRTNAQAAPPCRRAGALAIDDLANAVGRHFDLSRQLRRRDVEPCQARRQVPYPGERLDAAWGSPPSELQDEHAER